MTDLARTVAAEARAVEEGHHAILEPGGAIRVVSDTEPGKHYRVEFWQGPDGSSIVFRCRPAPGQGPGYRDHGDIVGAAGRLPCKHAALAARRLEREGLARFDPVDGWVLTGPVPRVGHVTATRLPADPMAGLP